MSPTKPRKWRRRLLWCVAFAVVVRVALEWSLPSLVELAGPSIGCRITCRDASLSLLGGDVAVHGLEVRLAERGDEVPLLRCDTVSGSIDVWQLLGGEVHVEDVRLLGAAATLLQREDGSFVLPNLPNGEPTAEPAKAEPAGPVDFSLPLRLSRLRALDLSLELRAAAAPASAPHERWLVDVTADRLGDAAPGRLGVRIHGQDRLDHIELQAELQALPDRIAAAWRADARGVRLESRLFDALRRPFDNPGRIADAELQGAVELRRNGDAALAAECTIDGALALDGTEAATFALRLGPASRSDGNAATPFSLRCDAPALWKTLAIEDGELRLADGAFAARAALRAEALTLDPLRRFLAEQGVLWPNSLDAALRLEAARTASGSVTIDLRDLAVGAAADRLTLAGLSVRDLQSTTTDVVVGAIEVTDLAAALTLTADGSLRAAGITLRTPTAADPVAAPETPTQPRPTSPQPAAATPRLRLDALRWRGLQFRVRDETLPEPAELSIADWSLQLDDLVLAADRRSGKAEVQLRLVGATERCTASLQLTDEPTATVAELALRAEGLAPVAVQPWLDRAGVRLDWQAARLQATTRVRIEPSETEQRVTANLGDVELVDGERRLLALGRVDLDGTSATTGFGLGALTLRGAELAMARRADGSLDVAGLLLPGAPTTPRAWRVTADGSLGAPNAEGRRTADFALAVPDTVDRLELRGDVAIEGERLGGDVALAATGLRGQGIASLLPPGLESSLQDGALRATLQVGHTPASGATEITLRDLVLNDGAIEWLRLPELRLDAPTISSREVHVRELRLTGLDLRTVEDPSGLGALGLRFAAAPAAAAAPATDPVTAPTSVTSRPRPTVGALPELRLDAATFELAALRRTTAQGTPLPTGTMTLRLREPWRMGVEPALADAMRWELLAAAAPLVDSVRADLELRPFALEPAFAMTFAVGPIDTTKFAETAPALAGLVEGRATAWRCSGTLDGHLELRRRDPLRFDLGRPFGAYLRLGDVVIADGDAPPFFALPEAEIQLRSFDPGSGALTIQRLEAIQPTFQVRRTAAGLEVAGICLPTATRTSAAAAAADPAGAPAVAKSGPAPEARIEIFTVQGLSCEVRDDTTTPATFLPIADLDLELRGASSRMFQEAIPIALRIDANGGDVELERRVERSSLLAGVVGSTAQMVALRGNRHEQELRPWFEQLSLQLDAALYPVFDGTFRLRLDTLEMPALRGLAAPSGVQIADGLLDLRVDGELRGTVGGVIRGLPVFRFLSITEPPGGPISTYLRLPAPLDTVLFLLRNEDGQHRLPIRIALDDHRLDPATIRDSAVETVALLISEAVGSTPWRIVTAATDLLGLRKKVDLAELAHTFAFEPGAATPTDADLDAIVRLLHDQPDRRIVLRHHAGAADLALAELRTNPPRDELLAQIERLRTARTAILAERAPLALDVAARLAAGRGTETWPLQDKLQAVDTRLGRLEMSLDTALAMLDQDSPSARKRRAGEGLRDLGSARLLAVRERLLVRLGPSQADRVETRSPRPTPKADLPGPGRVELTVR